MQIGANTGANTGTHHLLILAIEKITAERNGYVNELSYVSPDYLIMKSYVSPDYADYEALISPQVMCPLISLISCANIFQIRANEVYPKNWTRR